ncbi:MAG: signal peptidase I [Armatimonadota bacterium]
MPFSITIPQLAAFIGILFVIRLFLYFYEKKCKTQNRTFFLSEKANAVIKEWVDSIIIAGISAIIIIQFIVQPFYIPSESMYPTLKKWDFILVNKFIYRFSDPQKGDIVVFYPPPSAHAGDKEYIKRIVALPGDTVQVKDGYLYLNGKKQNEVFVKNLADYELEKLTIPRNKYFVLGDNRSNSGDSHVWGYLPQKNIVGKAFIIIWPPPRITILK